MADLTNFTDLKAISKTFRDLSCSVEFTRGLHNEQIFLSVVNILLSISAFLGNTLILVALHKETSLHPPSKLLYRNLAITDLCVGIIADPLQVAYLISVVNERSDICDYTFLLTTFTGYVLCLVSLLTVTAISVDRLLALLLGLRYRQDVTLTRAFVTVIVFWIFSIVGSSASFWNPLITTWYQYIVTAVCLVTTFFSYTKIFSTLIYNQVHVQDHVSQEQPSPSNSTEHSAIQKGSVQCNVGAGSIGCLLSAVFYKRSLNTSKRDVPIGFPCVDIYSDFSLL